MAENKKTTTDRPSTLYPLPTKPWAAAAAALKTPSAFVSLSTAAHAAIVLRLIQDRQPILLWLKHCNKPRSTMAASRFHRDAAVYLHFRSVTWHAIGHWADFYAGRPNPTASIGFDVVTVDPPSTHHYRSEHYATRHARLSNILFPAGRVR
jgi:hypothetical protein